jgi:UDP-N-acetylglucosamine 2-epimerase (non-hydrolysing)
MKKIISVVGARPNFMKAAPVHKAFQFYRGSVQHLICHTGQHYDEKMSKIFFEELELPQPDYYLGVGSGSHAEQTAKIMIEFEKILLKENPDLVMVYGDVNSTIACSLVSSKYGIKIAHVEAGLRSNDRSMPEEINRIVTDVLSDYCFVSEKSGVDNLLHEGVSNQKIIFVGNVMIDSLVYYLPKTEYSTILSTIGIEKDAYILVTLHRPSNVDSKKNLQEILTTLSNLSTMFPVVFPVHPRTRKNILHYELSGIIAKNVIIQEPLGYIDFLALMKNSRLIITDSGGIQEESTFLKVQCITTRENTERPVTTEIGTNYLVGTNWEKIEKICIEILNGNIKKGSTPELWDGRASERIVAFLAGNI